MREHFPHVKGNNLVPDDIASRIQKLMADRGMSMAAFAREIGDKPQRVRDVLRGKQKAPADMLEAIASLPRVDMQYLISGVHAVELRHERAFNDRMKEAAEVVAAVWSDYALPEDTKLFAGMQGIAAIEGVERKHLNGVAEPIAEWLNTHPAKRPSPTFDPTRVHPATPVAHAHEKPKTTSKATRK